MAVCALCNAEETQLYINEIPICLKCEEKRMRGELRVPPTAKQEPPHRPDAG